MGVVAFYDLPNWMRNKSEFVGAAVAERVAIFLGWRNGAPIL
jgi:hypothetical protein